MLSRTEYYESNTFQLTRLTEVISYSIVEGDRIQACGRLVEAVQSSAPLPEPIADPLLMGWHSVMTRPQQREE